ncbi:hypothetical protein GCM10022243_28740 [Saccharothrix violaceirubra]|uniref:non-specific serine/threonine protein kinase n=1 Tax=Saccharothrix violaceirubra TaxID=413306 RepID=A0A7W7T9V8_9PSEU|nr:serine/threonine-protein kinase [Saccharothrix violaceirubra]MBB4969201.1 serine/threonine protein kinase [Saccharothrix violaceirubra]
MPIGYPDTVFRYEPLSDRPVGRGGCGNIWKARDILLDRTVALKTVNEQLLWHDDERARRTFLKEATAGARLAQSSRHVVPVTDLGIADGIPYFVMPWIDNGTDPPDLGGQIGRMSVGRARAVLAQITEAVAVAHRNGIVHSDIAPWNIVHTKAENLYQLTDFGLLKIVENQLLSVGSGSLLRGGRQDFQPPEVRADIAAVDYSSDVYALAVTFRVLIEGDSCLRTKGGSPFPTPGVIRVRHEQRDAPDRVRQLLVRFVDEHERTDTVDDFTELLRRI